MAAFIKHDEDGNILSFGMMSVSNIAIQRTRENEFIKEVDSVEKGFDKKYKVQLDSEKNPILSMTGKAQLQRRFDRGVPMTEKEAAEINKIR